MTTVRSLAIRALLRVDEGAYANLVVPALLERSGLEERDRAFVTELVYGTTRMRRACDFLVDRYLLRPPDATVRAALRVGAYQLAFLGTPPHAAVSETVSAVPRRVRGVVNAVLRRVADEMATAGPSIIAGTDDATRLSYPDWVVDRLVADLGREDAMAALERMNHAATVTERPDGYVQDRASQWVAAIVGASPGERVADTCAGPGGKATAMARAGADVVAGDVSATRASLVAGNAARLGLAGVHVFAGDGRRPPLRPARCDRVLVDAPCSGLGVLRRRPDARWRVEAGDVPRLAGLQRELVAAGADLVRPGGRLVYSVCTLTAEETTGVAGWLTETRPDVVPEPVAGPPWRAWGTGGLVLPQDADTDGMAVFVWRRVPT